MGFPKQERKKMKVFEKSGELDLSLCLGNRYVRSNVEMGVPMGHRQWRF